MRHAQDYPSLNALRKKDAAEAVNVATKSTGQSHAHSPAGNPLAVRKLKRRRRGKTALRVTALSIALLLVASTVFAARLLTVDGVFGAHPNGFFAGLAALFGNSQPLNGENNDRVNILLLGYGGQGHDGPNLTDTIELASIKPSTHEVSLLSIPRDLYVDIPGFGSSKLNSAFAFGEENKVPGGGAAVAIKTLEQITGQSIPYYVTVDFKGFEQIVDKLAGIDVTIPRSFYDNLHRIQYDAGLKHFDGKSALYFVRARYVDGPEGGDFARAGRTQLIAKAIREKALALNPVADVGTITGILQSLGAHVRTNLQLPELRRVYEIVHDVPVDSILSRVIDDEETKLVYGDSRPMGGINASVLVASDPTFQAIHDYVAHVFDPLPPAAEPATIEVDNGTATRGIASVFVAELPTFAPKVTVLNATNADRSDYTESFIVDLSGGKRPQTVKLLQERLKAKGVNARVLPTGRYPTQSTADLVLVLGKDFADAIKTPTQSQ